jgi:hypothetical protein
MARATGRRYCSAGDRFRWGVALLPAALLVAAARPALPSSVHLVALGACWNPHSALVWLETSKVLTPEGVQEKWVVECQRDESTWKCDSLSRLATTRVGFRRAAMRT